MKGSTIWSCALPAKLWRVNEWKSDESLHVVAQLLNDAALLERRIQKRVNIDEERTKLGQCYERLRESILEELRRSPKAFRVLHLGQTYADLLYMARHNKAGRPGQLGSALITPAHMTQHLKASRELARRFGISGIDEKAARGNK